MNLLRILQPPIYPPASLARLVPLTGPAAFFLRFVRLLHSILTLPLLLLAVFLPSDTSCPPIIDPSWRLSQRLFARLVSQGVWFLTYGLPPAFLEDGRHQVPRLSWLIWGWPRGTHARSMRIGRADDWLRKGVLADEEAGPVEADGVDCFWAWRGRPDGPPRKMDGDNVMLYLVGGGFVSGAPLEGPLAWSLAGRLCLPIFCANYRKTTTDRSTAFPAALHDSLAAYSHLLMLGYAPSNIFLVGDSAGGGLCVTLTLYLASAGLPTPAGVIALSPWLDLTCSECSHIFNKGTDLLNSAQLHTAIAVYTANFPSPASASSSSGKPIHSTASLTAFGPAHPFFSPSLLPPTHPLLGALAQTHTRFLITYGAAERFADEDARFARSLKGAGVRGLEVDVELGGWHNCGLLPVGKNGCVERVLRKLKAFVEAGTGVDKNSGSDVALN